MKRTTFLLPGSFRFVGILFFIVGLMLGLARFYYGYKPELLNLKMFAFYSSYLETKYLEIIRNNICEELLSFLLLLGLFMIAFSREKAENEQTETLRLKAFFIASYLNVMFLLVAIFFTYGFGFVYMLMLNMGFGLLSFILAFRALLFFKPKKAENPIIT